MFPVAEPTLESPRKWTILLEATTGDDVRHPLSSQPLEPTSLLCILGVARISSVHSLQGWGEHQQS